MPYRFRQVHKLTWSQFVFIISLLLLSVPTSIIAQNRSQTPSTVRPTEQFDPYRGSVISLNQLSCGKVQGRWQLILRYGRGYVLFSTWKKRQDTLRRSSSQRIRNSAIAALRKFPERSISTILKTCRAGISTPVPTATPTITQPPAPDVLNLERLGRTMTADDVRHLYQRAAFGAVPPEAYELARTQGVEAVVDAMMEYHSAAQVEADAARFLDDNVDGTEVDPSVREWGLMYWSVYLLLHSPNRYHERFAFFFLHNLLATSQDVLSWHQKDLMLDHMNTLRSGAISGDYIPLLKSISRDPAMLIWLDGATNTKFAPNINYARELFELFTLGSPNPLFPQEKDYAEIDVRRSGRMHAGWGVDRIEVLPDVWANTRVLRSINVDKDPQILFEGTPCEKLMSFDAGTGLPRDMEVIDQTFACRRPEHLLAWKLAKEYLNETPDHDVVVTLASILRAEGFNFNRTLKTLFTSNVFYANSNRKSIAMSPVEMTIQGILKANMKVALLGTQGSSSTEVVRNIVWELRDAGFRLTKMPTVFGTKNLDYANSAWQLYLQNALSMLSYYDIFRPYAPWESAPDRQVLWTWSSLLPPGIARPTSSQIIAHLLPQFNLTELTTAQRTELRKVLDTEIDYDGEHRQIRATYADPFDVTNYWDVNYRLPKLWMLLTSLNSLR